ncbi:Uncharacterised protein [Burkholderia pseudomallei]|nr:Uncharacterised protein [Burkholderia pseudomallei]
MGALARRTLVGSVRASRARVALRGPRTLHAARDGRRGGSVVAARHRHEMRLHLLARPHALRAVHDDALARRQAAHDHALVAVLRAELHLAIRHAALLIDDEHELLVLIGVDRRVVDEQRRMRRAAAHLHARVEAGHERAVRVVEARTHADRARRRIEPVVDRIDHALPRVAALVREAELDGHLAAVLRAADVLQVSLLVRVERRVDRRHRHERRERCGRRARRHDVAERDLRARHAARHGRGDPRVAEVDARRLERGLGRLQVRRGLARGVLLLVVIALGDRVVADQPLRALPVALCVAIAGLRAGELRGRAIDLGLIRARIDHEQHVALLHERAVLEIHRHDRAGHERAHVDLLDRLEAARVGLPIGDRLRQHGRDVDLRQRRRRFLRRARIHADRAERAEARDEDDRERRGRDPRTGSTQDSHEKTPRLSVVLNSDENGVSPVHPR